MPSGYTLPIANPIEVDVGTPAGQVVPGAGTNTGAGTQKTRQVQQTQQNSKPQDDSLKEGVEASYGHNPVGTVQAVKKEIQSQFLKQDLDAKKLETIEIQMDHLKERFADAYYTARFSSNFFDKITGGFTNSEEFQQVSKTYREQLNMLSGERDRIIAEYGNRDISKETANSSLSIIRKALEIPTKGTGAGSGGVVNPVANAAGIDSPTLYMITQDLSNFGWAVMRDGNFDTLQQATQDYIQDIVSMHSDFADKYEVLSSLMQFNAPRFVGDIVKSGQGHGETTAKLLSKYMPAKEKLEYDKNTGKFYSSTGRSTIKLMLFGGDLLAPIDEINKQFSEASAIGARRLLDTRDFDRSTAYAGRALPFVGTPRANQLYQDYLNLYPALPDDERASATKTFNRDMSIAVVDATENSLRAISTYSSDKESINGLITSLTSIRTGLNSKDYNNQIFNIGRAKSMIRQAETSLTPDQYVNYSSNVLGLNEKQRDVLKKTINNLLPEYVTSQKVLDPDIQVQIDTYGKANPGFGGTVDVQDPSGVTFSIPSFGADAGKKQLAPLTIQYVNPALLQKLYNDPNVKSMLLGPLSTSIQFNLLKQYTGDAGLASDALNYARTAMRFAGEIPQISKQVKESNIISYYSRAIGTDATNTSLEDVYRNLANGVYWMNELKDLEEMNSDSIKEQQEQSPIYQFMSGYTDFDKQQLQDNVQDDYNINMLLSIPGVAKYYQQIKQETKPELVQ